MQRFADQLLCGLKEREVEASIFFPPVIAGRLKSGTSGLGKWLGYIDKYFFAPFALLRCIRESETPVVVHICDHSNSHYTNVLKSIPHLVTCHDLLAVRSALGEFEQNRPAWFGRQQQAIIVRGLKRARSIACVSRATADDVLRITDVPEHRVVHIPNSIDSGFIEEARSPSSRISRDDLSKLTGLPDDASYLMHIGSGSWYKNRECVLQIFASIATKRDEVHLIIVGPEFDQDTLSKNHCGDLSGRIHYLTGISDHSLRQLYRSALLLLFPSLLEGFGWPILEAQSCGCGVATLDRAPMNELNSTPSLILPPETNSSDWAVEAADKCLDYIDLPDDLRSKAQTAMKAFAAQFTNEASANAYLELYKNLLKADTVS